MADDYASAVTGSAYNPVNKRSHSGSRLNKSNSSVTHFSKFIALILCLGCDLALNSILDYDLFNDQYRGVNSGATATAQLLVGLAGLQVVIQIAIFLIVFLSMADTFLFRVGLLGLLLKKFRTVLAMHPVYIAFTIALGAYRVRHFNSNGTLNELWKDSHFIGLSIVQKCVAIMYYLLNMRASIKLGDSIYLNKDAWIALVKQRKQAERDNDLRYPGSPH